MATMLTKLFPASRYLQVRCDKCYIFNSFNENSKSSEVKFSLRRLHDLFESCHCCRGQFWLFFESFCEAFFDFLVSRAGDKRTLVNMVLSDNAYILKSF